MEILIAIVIIFASVVALVGAASIDKPVRIHFTAKGMLGESYGGIAKLTGGIFNPYGSIERAILYRAREEFGTRIISVTITKTERAE